MRKLQQIVAHAIEYDPARAKRGMSGHMFTTHNLMLRSQEIRPAPENRSCEGTPRT